MYSIDRSAGAKLLGISLRTIDRHIQSGRIRSKRIGRKVFLHDDDIKIVQNGGIQEEYTILDTSDRYNESGFRREKLETDYKKLFEDEKSASERKDRIIQDLSYRVGAMEAELKNSISMIEFKKTTFLLESSKTKVEEEKTILNNKVADLQRKVSEGKTWNTALLILLIVLILLGFVGWFFTAL